MSNAAVAFETEYDGSDLEEYAPTQGLRELKSAINNLKRLFPTVLNIPTDDSARFILLRTMQHMLHADTTFSMQSTFDNELFERMKLEGEIYKNWLDSEDDHWPPAGLEYRPLAVNDPEGDEDETPTIASTETDETVSETVEPVKVVERKPRSVSNNSRYQRGKAMFLEDIKSGRERAYTLKRMESELDLNAATANVYYSKYKTECNVS